MQHVSKRQLYPITVHVPGAIEAELTRGIVAAMDHLAKSGFTPKEASDGAWKRDGWDIEGFPEGGISKRNLKAATVWDEASGVAVAAVCADWGPDRERPIYGWAVSLVPGDQSHG